jgi:GAF domain-containing protein
MANLSLEHGNSDGSCFAYACLGSLLGARFGNYRAGYSFGKLGLDLVEQRGLRRFKARVDQVFGAAVLPWTQPLRTGRGLLLRAFDVANSLGDLTYAGFSRFMPITNLLAGGEPLADVQREAETGLEFVRQIRHGLVVDIITGQLRLIRVLRGLTPAFVSFNDPEFDEDRFEQHLADDPGLSVAGCFYWIRKLQARFFAGAYGAAIEAAAKVQGLLWTIPSFFEAAEYHLYAALSRAALCDAAAAVDRAQCLEALSVHHRQVEAWAENCPANFADRAALLGAEIARLEGREPEAGRLYEQAIRCAREQGFVQHEALAYELAARFYAAGGFGLIAHLYLQQARHCYVRWGADGKVRQLDGLYPRLRDDEPAPNAGGTIGAPVEQLELATVLKVSQAVSGEIMPDKLVLTVLRTAIEQAGAERGVLIVPQGDELRIRAEARTDDGTMPILLRDIAISSADLPESVVRYAARARERVSLDDGSARSEFSNDAYIRREQPRSVLCVPLIQQGQLMALLYLENNLAAGVFTPSRMALLNVLASQAAMSLEKTRLYQELQQREAKIRRLVEANIIGIITCDLDGRITDANDAFLRMLHTTVMISSPVECVGRI